MTDHDWVITFCQLNIFTPNHLEWKDGGLIMQNMHFKVYFIRFNYKYEEAWNIETRAREMTTNF